MELRHLRYFVAVAEEGHFGRAARRLNIVQPALSMQIRSLEEEVGGLLFVRTSRKVALTEAGELLLVEARRTLAQADRTKERVQSLVRGEIGSVRVAFSGNSVMSGRLQDDLRAFNRLFPAVQLDLSEMAPPRHSGAVASGQIDVSYTPSFGITFDPTLTTDKVGTWPMVLALAADHPLAKRKVLSVDELGEETLVLYHAAFGEEGLALLHQQVGHATHAVHRVDSTLSALGLVASGLGLAVVPDAMKNLAIPNLIFRPMKESIQSAELMLVSRTQETSGAVRAFVQVALRNRKV